MTKPTEEELLLLNQAVKNEKIVSFMMFLVEGVFLGVVAFFGIIGKIQDLTLNEVVFINLIL